MWLAFGLAVLFDDITLRLRFQTFLHILALHDYPELIRLYELAARVVF